MTRAVELLLWIAAAILATVFLPQLSGLDDDIRIAGIFLLSAIGIGYVATSQNRRIDALSNEIAGLKAALERIDQYRPADSGQKEEIGKSPSLVK